MDMKKRPLNNVLKKDIEAFMELDNAAYQMHYTREYATIGDSLLYGGKNSGSEAEKRGAEYIAKELTQIGIQNVELIPLKTSKFQFNDADLTIIESGESGYSVPSNLMYHEFAEKNRYGKTREIKPYGYTAPGTLKEGVEASLVDVGDSRHEFYKENDVKGKLVLVEGMGVLEGSFLSAQFMEAENNGAIGIIAFVSEDILDDETIRVQPLNYIPKIPVVGISLADANYLRTMLVQDEKIRLNLRVDSELVLNGGTSYSVVGEIPGTSIDERILFSSHLDHHFRCLQDNISAVTTLLGIAKSMISIGYKPKRTITFVFNGSHETGMLDSRYPYISGSYNLIDGPKKEWIGKTIIDINFEYTALLLNELRGWGSWEINGQYADFLRYMPNEMEGFKNIAEDVNSENYFLFAWADTISYISKGIPVFMNDSISEQIYTQTSPYIGRDHSNHDDWDVYSKEALNSNTKWYGAFGIYFDSMPIAQMDFSARVLNIKEITDVELIRSLGIDIKPFEAIIDNLAEVGEKLYKNICNFNDNIVVNKVAEGINRKLLIANKAIVDTLDKINSQDMITTGHRKYTDNIKQIHEAIRLLENGNPEKVLDEVLRCIDIAASSYYFSKEVVEHAQKRICSPDFKHTRLWARGKELSSLTLFDVVNGLKDKIMIGDKDYNNEISELKAAACSEIELLEIILKDEVKGLEEAVQILQSINFKE